MPRYIRKPTIAYAFQCTGEAWERCVKIARAGGLRLDPGDWMIEEGGKHFTLKPGEFAATFDAMPDQTIIMGPEPYSFSERSNNEQP